MGWLVFTIQSAAYVTWEANMRAIVLRSPVYFIFLLLCCAAAYVVHTLNLWGPILRVTNAMGQQAVDIGKVCIIHRVCAFI